MPTVTIAAGAWFAGTKGAGVRAVAGARINSGSDKTACAFATTTAAECLPHFDMAMQQDPRSGRFRVKGDHRWSRLSAILIRNLAPSARSVLAGTLFGRS
jgi:hypothetical protein